MLDHNRLNDIIFTAVAFYLATILVQLHARQPSWHAVQGVSFQRVAAAVQSGVVEAVKLQGGETTMLASFN